MPRECGASSSRKRPTLIEAPVVTGSSAGVYHRAGRRPDPLADDDSEAGSRARSMRAFGRFAGFGDDVFGGRVELGDQLLDVVPRYRIDLEAARLRLGQEIRILHGEVEGLA